MDKTLGKAIPYGVYDLNENEGWVSVGIDHDTRAPQGASRARIKARSVPGTISHCVDPVLDIFLN
jgi:hypothetical protein